MDPFIIAQTIDLAGENPPRLYRQPLAGGDSGAHRWEVRIVRGGQAADLTGCTAAVLARREDDESGVTVRQSATIEGNMASAEFLPEVYALGGRLLAVMVISDSTGRVVTSAALRMQGKQYATGSISDPEGTIPSLEALLARYNDLLSATEAARAATEDARAATEATQAALGDAQTAVTQAQTAVAQAQAALRGAQTAADTANAAAGKINDMTVSATPVETGTATAALSTVDGHYHLALGLPKGDTGATPQISVQVQTGAAGSEASVSISGTAEEPVIHLTIPRGDVGDIGNLTINGKTPDGSGAVTLMAADVGALPTGGTAADSSKLGGKSPEYYLQPRNLLDNSWWKNLKEIINQRGETNKQADWVYWIDRWLVNTTSAAAELRDGGIYLPATTSGNLRMVQRIPIERITTGQAYTLAVCESDGTIRCVSGVYNNDVVSGDVIGDGGMYIILQPGEETYVYFVIDCYKNFTIRWAALYEGSYTAETLPPYVPKGYAAELAECQRYYQIIRLYRHLSTNYDNEYRYYGYSLPVKMRAKPAVTIEYMDEYKVNSFDKNSLTSYSGESYSNFEGMAISFMCKSEFGTVLSQCYVSTKIACTADL